MLQRNKAPKIHRRQKRLLRVYLVIWGIVLVGVVGVSIAIVFAQSNGGLISPVPFWGKHIKQSIAKENSVSKIEESLKAAKIQYKMVTRTDENTYEVMLESGEMILIGRSRELASQISSLQLIYSRLTMEGKAFRKLDLRFDKPVIVFK